MTVIPESLRRKKPIGDSVTGKLMTNLALIAIDTRIFVAHRMRRVDHHPSAASPYLTQLPHRTLQSITGQHRSLFTNYSLSLTYQHHWAG
jgi:hypothetical protein